MARHLAVTTAESTASSPTAVTAKSHSGTGTFSSNDLSSMSNTNHERAQPSTTATAENFPMPLMKMPMISHDCAPLIFLSATSLRRRPVSPEV